MAIYSWFTNSTRWIVHSYVSLPESNIFGISWNHQPPTGFFANRASQSQRSQENVRHCPTWSGSGWALACCCFCSCLMVTDFRGMEPPKVSSGVRKSPLSGFIMVYLCLPHFATGGLNLIIASQFPPKKPRGFARASERASSQPLWPWALASCPLLVCWTVVLPSSSGGMRALWIFHYELKPAMESYGIQAAEAVFDGSWVSIDGFWLRALRAVG